MAAASDTFVTTFVENSRGTKSPKKQNPAKIFFKPAKKKHDSEHFVPKVSFKSADSLQVHVDTMEAVISS